MEVYLSGDTDGLKNAKEWFNNADVRDPLSEVERLIKARERKWGRSAVFIEFTLPRTAGIAGSQVDLLISFADRALICEIKQGYSRQTTSAFLNRPAKQISNQISIAHSILKIKKGGPKSLSALLWTPNIRKYDELNALARYIRGTQNWKHIAVTTSDPKLRGVNLDQGIPVGQEIPVDQVMPAYLPEAIDWRLRALDGVPSNERPMPYTETLTAAFHGSYDWAGQRMLRFSTFDELRYYLSSDVPDDDDLIADPTYIHGLRSEASNRAVEILTSTHLVEILGPQGVGKSSFIKEIVTRLLSSLGGPALDARSVVLREKRTVLAVLRSIAIDIGILPAEQIYNLSQDVLLAKLARWSFVFRISDYDQRSQLAVTQLIAAIRSLKSEKVAYWVVESMVPAAPHLSEARDWQVPIEPLSPAEMFTILAKHEPGLTTRDVNAIITDAQGIPRNAILRWTAGNDGPLQRSDRMDHYALLFQSLSKEERSTLRAIAYILSESPLGTTIRLIEEWCKNQGLGRSDEARRRARFVIQKAYEWRLINLDLFGSVERLEESRQTSNPDMEVIIATFLPTNIYDALSGWIRVLDPHFIEHCVEEQSLEKRIEFNEELQRILYENLKDDLALTGVTLSLINGEFETFVRSSFRSSFRVLMDLAAWIETRDEPIGEPARRLAEIRRWLDWVIGNFTGKDLERTPAERMPFEPSAIDAISQLLYDTARVRSEAYWNGSEYEWEQWHKAAEDLWAQEKFDLWGEATLCQAQVRLRDPYNNPRLAWTLMQEVLKQENKLSKQSGRSMLYFHALSLLNKGHVLRDVPGLDAAPEEWIPRLAGRMIDCGLAMENIGTIGNALFFFARHVEMNKRNKSPEQMALLLQAMRLVERVSPARRIHSLLTQGSIYRHRCSEQDIDWLEFRRFADDALHLYSRAFESARSVSSVTTNAMNALSYMGQLCIQALRFRDEGDVDGWLRERAPGIVKRTDWFVTSKLVEYKVLPNIGSLQVKLILNTCKSRVLLGLLLGKWQDDGLRVGLPEHLRSMSSRFRELGCHLKKTDRIAMCGQAMEELKKVISFASHNAVDVDVANSCGEELLEFLTDMSLMLPVDPVGRSKSSLLRHGRALLATFELIGINVPANLQSAFLREDLGSAKGG